MRTPGRSSGFTLIELLIVIAIIGILAAVLLPNMLGLRHKSIDAAAKIAARNVVNAMAALEAGNTAGADVTDCTFAGGEVTFTMTPAINTSSITVKNISKNITDVTCTSDASQYRVEVAYFGGSNSTLDFKSVK